MYSQPLAISTLLLLVFAGTIGCAPISPKKDTFSIAQTQVSHCGDASFNNQTSDASPLVSDCKQLAYNIRNGDAFWRIGAGQYRQLAQYKSCAFGGTATDQAWVFVGNQDIMDLISDTLKRFYHQDQIGAFGSMPCDGSNQDGEHARFYWSIYHT